MIIYIAIFILGVLFGIALAIAAMMFIVDKCVPNEEEDYLKLKEEKGNMSNCEKCKEPFRWYEKDALIKYKYGSKFIVHCPHCNKLTKVYKEEEG